MVSRRKILTLFGAGVSLFGAGILANKMGANSRDQTSIKLMGPNKIPNVPLITHHGEQVYFYDDLVQDKILIINMMYSSCSGICPLATTNLKHVHKMLSQHLSKPFVMCSLTLTPEIDNAAMLAYYVEKHHLPHDWLYLTGEIAHVNLVRKSLGFYDIDPLIDNDTATHIGMVRLGNEAVGRWSMMPSQTAPSQIVDSIKHLARQT